MELVKTTMQEGPILILAWKCYTEVNHIFLFDPAWYHSDTLKVK